MSLGIRTFDNRARSGDPLFKALGHPAVTQAVRSWIEKAAGYRSLAVVDPWGQYSSLGALFDVSRLNIEARYVQKLEDLNAADPLSPVRSLLDLRDTKADAILLATFDGDHARRAFQPILPRDLPILSFDELKIPPGLITNQRRYLDPINFCTNFALFRAGAGRHSVVRTAEYWTGYGATAPRLFMILLAADGTRLAEWEAPLAPRQSIVLDAGEVRERFSLPPFEGMLFIHAVGIAGHDIMKYVLDDLDDSCADPAVTHDSNSWPAEYYSGLPAPREGESVRLWLQNCHPSPVPAGAIGMGVMGHDFHPLERAIPGFGTYCVAVEEHFPQTRWPAQLEIATGNHVVRPRYEIVGDRTVTFAHMNVERTDLSPDPDIRQVAPLLGKGYLLPAPLLPLGEWRNYALPTPAARGQEALPLSLIVYDSEGRRVLDTKLGIMTRDELALIDVNALLAEAGISNPGLEGHFELVYDFSHGVDADGWLHALFRYEDKNGRQMGDTSFGAHIFNLPITFKDEPQSYAGKPPGLSSRLFGRMMPVPLDVILHLIYPSSGSWHPQSDTTIVLHDHTGTSIAEFHTRIPLHGSRLLKASLMFDANAIAAAGPRGYMIISDRTCRLFGYHGVVGPEGQFALDHMFGF
jgi:hypothetical protein